MGNKLAFHKPRSLPFMLPCQGPSHCDTISPTLKGYRKLFMKDETMLSQVKVPNDVHGPSELMRNEREKIRIRNDLSERDSYSSYIKPIKQI